MVAIDVIATRVLAICFWKVPVLTDSPCQAGQNVWARQLDDEAVGTKISNLGDSLSILGHKTENSGPDRRNLGRN